MACIAGLYKSYLKVNKHVIKISFYSNKVNTIKLIFDSKFNNIDEESLIQVEILHQMDKTLLLLFMNKFFWGGNGFEVGNLSGFDIKAIDNILFAILSFTEIPKKIEDCIFEKLAKQANIFKKSACYFASFLEKWIIVNNDLTMSHKHLFKISANKFYNLL